MGTMNKGLIDKGLKYGIKIMNDSYTYIDFSVNLIDYMGKDICPFCSLIYGMIFYSNTELLSRLGIKPDGRNEILKYSNDVLLRCYKEFLIRQEEEKKKQELQNDIDEIMHLIKAFRSKEEFLRMINFIAINNHLSSYNAMMIEKQKPSCTFVYNAKTWDEKYNRQPKPNAQNLVALKPFGPIQWMYDFSDTEQIPGRGTAISEVDLMEEHENMFSKARGEIDITKYNCLIDNLSQYGILLDDKFNAGNRYCGYIRSYENKEFVLYLNTGDIIKRNSKFLISVNKNENKECRFVTICHELAHLFCRHLFYDMTKCRRISRLEEEFEAETVAWIVCKRHGVYNPSEEYLASYVKDDIVPMVSLDCMMSAITEIEKMLTEHVYISDTLWYKNDKELKYEVDLLKKKYKKKKNENNYPSLFDL